MSTGNPFQMRPLGEDGPCLGRDFLIDEIGGSLQGASPVCFEIIGEIKSGKTSLLKHFHGRGFLEEHAPEPDGVLPLFFELSGYVESTPDSFWLDTYDKLIARLNAIGGPPAGVSLLERDDVSFHRLAQLFKDLKQRGYTALLLFDDFEILVHNRGFDVHFFTALRNLQQVGGEVRYIVASRESMFDMMGTSAGGQDLEYSEFHRSFQQEYLEPLTEDEVREVIEGLLEGNAVQFDEEQIGLIGRLSGGFPHFLNLAGRTLYECSLKKTGDPIATTVRRFERSARSTLQHYWRHCDDAARSLLTAAAAVGTADAGEWLHTGMLVDELRRGAFDPRTLDRLTINGFLVEGKSGLLSVQPEVYRKYVWREVISEVQKLQRGQLGDEASDYHRWLAPFVHESTAGQASVPLSGDAERTVDLPSAEQEVRQKSNGRYEPQGRLGDGSFGVVLRARDKTLEQDVAIKVIHRQHRHHEELMARFRREAKVLRNLTDCKEVVLLWDVADDMSYIVMELVEGRSLREHLQEVGKMPVREALTLGMRILNALAAAHRQNIVHRDLNPNNVMLLADGSPKVADFGLATWDRSIRTHSGQILGTPAYMSPEQYFGWSKIDGRADIFSLGVMLYEILAGERLRRTEGTVNLDREKVNQSLAEGITGPDAEQVCAEIIDLLAAAVADEPEQRIQSAVDMRGRLEAILGRIA